MVWPLRVSLDPSLCFESSPTGVSELKSLEVNTTLVCGDPRCGLNVPTACFSSLLFSGGYETAINSSCLKKAVGSEGLLGHLTS